MSYDGHPEIARSEPNGSPDQSVPQRDPVEMLESIHHAQEGTAGLGGLVFGVRDTRNFYAAVVDPIGQAVKLVRLSDGRELPLAQASITLKKVDWHSLRLQRNTIISKDFVEVFVDGVLVLSVEDQALGLGQIGLVVLGTSTVLFDSFHACSVSDQDR